MADADIVTPYRFRWNIENPFFPLQRMVTSFHYWTSAVRHWQVVLQPSSPQLTSCNFSFLLIRVQFDEEDDSFTPDLLEVDISLNGEIVVRKNEPRYLFGSENQNSYRLQTTLSAPPTTEPYHLSVEVRISFRGRIRPEDGLFFHQRDLKILSKDMLNLLEVPYHPDMRIASSDFQIDPFPVHYCILAARWKNFLKVYKLDAIPEDVVNTNISPLLLQNILEYIYTGTMILPDDTEEAYISELLQVIKCFSLHHLYKHFVTRDSDQEQNTVRDIITKSFKFQLDDESNKKNVFSWGGDVQFRIQFHMSAGVPWFAYSLQWLLGSRCYARVNIEVIIEPLNREEPMIRTVHVRDYAMRRGNPQNFGEIPENSGTCHFEGLDRNFRDLLWGDQRRMVVRRTIRCTLSFSDGTLISNALSPGNNQWMDELERLHDLSDHLKSIRTNPVGADLTIQCPSNPPEVVSHLLHKSIFVSRVPGYQNDQIFVPPVMTCLLKSEAFQYVLDYIYTGKTLPIPFGYLDDIAKYAEEWKFSALQNLVERMRVALY